MRCDVISFSDDWLLRRTAIGAISVPMEQENGGCQRRHHRCRQTSLTMRQAGQVGPSAHPQSPHAARNGWWDGEEQFQSPNHENMPDDV